MRKSIKIFDYFFVLRPTLFFPVWTLSLAGLWAQARFGRGDTEVPDFSIAVALACLTLLMGGVFVLNQLEDVETDRLNNKLYLIANGDISQRNAYVLLGVLVLASIAIVFPKRPDLATVMGLAFVVMGWLYSSAPFKLKDRPIGGIIANMLGGYIIFSFGWMIHGNPGWEMIHHATPYILGMLAVYFFTTIPDREGDRATDKITVAVKWGVNPVLYGGVILDGLAILSAALTRDWVVLAPTLLVFPFFVRAAKSKAEHLVLQTNKFAALFLSLIICIRFPLYLVLMVGLFFFSKWYYRKRFDLDYPSLRS